MSRRRCAFIDIGTNTILCLVVEYGDSGALRVLDDLAEITRLGRAVDQTRRISVEGEERSSAVLRHYLQKCANLGVHSITAVGTSALREAENSSDVRKRWYRDLGLDVHVISGHEEARYSFLAACEGLSLAAGLELLVIDIGGGSTEFIRGKAAGISEAVSIDVGSVRLTERYLHSDPVVQTECDAMEKAVDLALAPLESFRPHDFSALTLVGIAGTFTTMAAVEKRLSKYTHSEVHGSLLSLSEVRRQRSVYQNATIEQRKELPGLHPMRADVIFAGAYLVEKIMTKLKQSQIIVSDQGVRYGLLYDRLMREKSIDISC